MTSTHIKELDGLRAVAILSVIAWHYIGTPDGPTYWPWKAIHVGRFGVDLFFVLSGYLITSILLKNSGSESYFSAFYYRRAFRILPLYYFMCVILIIGIATGCVPALFDTRGVSAWTYLVGLQNVAMAKAQSDGAYWLSGSWSLAIEEQFYLLFPFIVRRMEPEKLLSLLLLPIVMCPVARIIDAPLQDPYGWYVLPQFRVDSLAIGALVACWRACREPSKEISLAVRRWFKRSLICLPLLWILGWSRWSVAFSHTLVEIFFGLTLFLVLENQGAQSMMLLRSKGASFVAQTSYAAYLFHPVVIYLVFAATGQIRTMRTPAGVALTGAAFVLTFVLSAISYRFIERPLIEYGHRRFTYYR